jgi:alkylation response protein AidB-like acyl-CoA dehydrogenase
MIEFQSSDEEKILVETAERFGIDKLFAEERAHEKARAYPEALRRDYDELGFVRLGFPADLGGSELPLPVQAAVWMALAKSDPGAALGLTPWPIPACLATLPQIAERIGKGRKLFFVADTPLTLAKGMLDGQLDWLPAPSVDELIVVHGDIIGLATPTSVQLLPDRPCGLHACGGVRVEFDDAVFGEIGDAALAARAKAEARVFAAALMLGAARHSYEYAQKYAQDRITFGKPIAHHQGVAFQLADCATQVDGAELLLLAAAARPEAVDEIANAYVLAVETAEWIVDRGVQLLGGHGYLYDHPVEKRMRDVRSLALLYGGSAAAQTEVSDRILSFRDPLAPI